MQRIAVIGGGIAGLTVALRRARAGDRVVVFEGAAALGGQLASESSDGFVVEHGAEGFLARSDVVPALAADAGIADHIVEQLEQRSFCFDGTQLRELAPGEAGRLLGFQVATEELGRGIRSFLHGMGELPERLAHGLSGQVELRLESAVKRIEPGAGGVVVTPANANANAEAFTSVVIASNARSCAGVLGDAFGPVAHALADSALLSSLTVSLAFRRERILHPLDGTGFIVPDPEQLSGVRAVTFVSSKLPHRAPAGGALLRLFFRPSDHDLVALSDRAWAERAESALGRALPLSGPADRAWISRWPAALPVFDDSHRARVAALESALTGQRIWLAGSAFHGSGIDAAIRSAERAALSVAHA